MSFLLAVHIPIDGLPLLFLLFDVSLIFSPIDIAFLELIIDPVSSIVFESEAEEADVMRQPPRDPRQPFASLISANLALVLVNRSLSSSLFVALKRPTPTLQPKGGRDDCPPSTPFPIANILRAAWRRLDGPGSH